MNKETFTIVVPGVLEEIDCKSYQFQDMRDALRKTFDFRDITIKFLKKNQDQTSSFTDKPFFVDNIATFRVYRGNKFISMAELRIWN